MTDNTVYQQGYGGGTFNSLGQQIGTGFFGNRISPTYGWFRPPLSIDDVNRLIQNQQQAPTGVAPHMQFSFDTIGQTIFRSVGHCRLPLRTLWVQGIQNEGDMLPEGATSYTFAAALCAPFDPTETGDFFQLYDGNSLIFDQDSGILPPVDWAPSDQELLITALTAATFYPGDEAQLPDPLILADRGAEIANAFRGLRYVVIPGYPLRPPPSVVFRRTNTISNVTAVEVAAGIG